MDDLQKLLSVLVSKAEYRRKQAEAKGDLVEVLEADLDLKNLEWVRLHPQTAPEYLELKKSE